MYEAYKAVKSNGGAAGVDGQTIEQFEANLRESLQDLEQDELGKLLSAAGACCPHTEEDWGPADFIVTLEIIVTMLNLP